MSIILMLLLTNSAPNAVPAHILAPAIKREADANGLDPVLLTKVLLLESRGVATARSNRDHGIMQINEVHNLSGLCLYDWRCNLHHGARILASMPRTCQYNVGASRVLKGNILLKCLTYERKVRNIVTGGTK